MAKTSQERQRERRAERLKEIKRQVDEGSLVIRKMTARERAKYAPRAKPDSSRRNRPRR